MTSSIKEKITDDMKTAMRNQEKERLSTIRLILAALKQREVDERITLTDEHVMAILDKMLKQRRESVAQFQTAKRDDLVKKEMAEIEIIQQYLPAQLSDHEIKAIIEKAIADSGAASQRDIGKIMAIVKPQLQGRADLAAVSAKIKERLSA
jgi:uncharacterized protein YqeY